ncbi:hypothetical protein LZ30DRAFT_728155 [Colletotrichum cereale]|nr:hypothetical protein LZ30DRAFT_728155 [Colletotrichum cereale]
MFGGEGHILSLLSVAPCSTAQQGRLGAGDHQTAASRLFGSVVWRTSVSREGKPGFDTWEGGRAGETTTMFDVRRKVHYQNGGVSSPSPPLRRKH